MTSKTIFSFILAAAFVTISCKNELEPQESVTESESVVVADDNVAPIDATNAGTDMQAPPVQMNPQVQQQQQQQPTSQKVAPGMNPAHGQPGHRCEIPVGAPLNSAPAAGTKPAPTLSSGPIQNNPPAATPSILNPASSTVKAGMNPEHGQPGHRCDIAVGQPLP